MDQLLQQIVAGLETGSSYALIGLAVVVIMKSTDVPNFAMAEMGLVAAFMAWFLSGDPDKGGVGWPFWLAIVLALAFAAVFGAITQFFLVRPLTGLSNQPLAIFAALGLGYASVGFINDEGLPSFLDWFPVTKGGFPLAVAIILAIFTVVLTYLMIRHWVKPLAIVDHFPLLLLTIGLNFALGSVIENIWGSTPKRFNAPWSGETFDLGSTRIGWDQVVTITVGIAIAIAMALFFWSKWGVRMRAIAEDGPTARLLGINAGMVSLIAWAIGTLVAGAAMILNTSSTVLELGSAEGLILKGFIAAVLGGFTSLGGTFIGGLLIGVGEALAGGQISTSLQPTIALLVVVVVLLVAPGGFSRSARTREV
ncbi:branched-chain amino acid ABC transporter permease [Candidatus Poriferisocius sp.]|uniref:branched-chain amino acid ABC transporter permease n=1 Tax=Candidatus Poriferisocius sp. TaxID=3101276 RepID=UPI003B01705E